jgi:hypothetical protein
MISSSTWDNVCPVLLPLGAPTIAPLISASMGLFVPFLIFAMALYAHVYSIWTVENGGSQPMDGYAYASARYPARLRVSVAPASAFFRSASRTNTY